MTYIPSDDDDLFEYEPENEVQEEATKSHTSSNTSYNSDYIDSVKETLRNTNVDVDSSGVNQAQVALSTAFYDGTHHWINNDANVNSFVQSVSFVLDQLTDNDYSKIRYFKEVEFKLSKKLLVDLLMREAFNITSSSDYEDGIKGIMKEMFDVDFSDLYMKICYTLLYDTNKHVIHLDRIIYTALAAELDFPVKDVLFSDDPSLSELYAVTGYSSEYNEKVQEILSEIINPDLLEMAKINENTQVHYRTKKQS